MHTMLKRSISLAAAAVMLSGTVLGAAAQDESSDGTVPAVPQPEECVSEPRDQADIDAAMAAGEAIMSLPNGLPVPLGTVADDATQTAVKATVRELIACLNAGDVLRGASLFSDNGLSGFVGPSATDDSAGEQAPVGTPTARSEEQWLALRTVTDVSRMDDGRIAAFVVLNDPLVRGPRAQTLLFVFIEDEDGWLIDGVVGFSPLVPVGTPTP